MTITGISNPLNATSHLFRQDFKKIGQDLKSGDLSAAQQDLLAMQKDLRAQFDNSTTGAQNNHVISMGPGNSVSFNALRKELNDLGQALATGDVSAAKQAYTTIKSPKYYTEPPLMQPPAHSGKRFTGPFTTPDAAGQPSVSEVV